MPRVKRTRYVVPGPAADGDTAKVAFARNLNTLLLRKGWKQSDFANAAQKHMPKGAAFGRHLISAYMTGKNLPNPINLTAMAKALGVETTDLVPPASADFVGTEPPSMKLEFTPNGKARIFIDMELETDKAMRIMAIVNEQKVV